MVYGIMVWYHTILLPYYRRVMAFGCTDRTPSHDDSHQDTFLIINDTSFAWVADEKQVESDEDRFVGGVM